MPVRLLLLSLLLVMPLTAPARDRGQDEALQLRREGVVLPMEALLQRAMQHYPGARLLEVDLHQHHSRYRYEIELLTTSGQVRELEFDAASGELLKDEEDN